MPDISDGERAVILDDLRLAQRRRLGGCVRLGAAAADGMPVAAELGPET